MLTSYPAALSRLGFSAADAGHRSMISTTLWLVLLHSIYISMGWWSANPRR